MSSVLVCQEKIINIFETKNSYQYSTCLLVVCILTLYLNKRVFINKNITIIYFVKILLE